MNRKSGRANQCFEPAVQLLPVLVEGVNYDELPIAGGNAASHALEQLLVYGEPADGAAQKEMRKQLLAYCKMDTWGLRELLGALMRLAVET